jgi:DNA-binding protein H-NS
LLRSLRRRTPISNATILREAYKGAILSSFNWSENTQAGHYDITAAELGLVKRERAAPAAKATKAAAGTKKVAAKAKAKPKAKATAVQYQGPNGETWGGGRGKRPNWVNAILAAGGDIEDYRVS